MFGLGIFETAALHVVVHHWTPRGAWLLTGVSVLGLLLIGGIASTLRLKPAVVTATEIVLSFGILTSIRAPIAAVSDINASPSTLAKSRGLLRMSLMQPPNVLVEFARPIRANILYLGSRPIRSVAAHLDSPAEFIGAVNKRRITV
jgi:hypothetical protein